MTLLEVKDEYISQLKALLEGRGFVRVRGCAGVMSETEVEAYANTDTPALYIGVIGTGVLRPNSDVVQGEVNVVMYIFCRSTESASASNIALELVNKVVIESKNIAHDDFVGLLTCEDTSNLYSKTMQDMDVSMWAMRFSQEVVLETKVIETIGSITNKGGSLGDS